MSGFGRRMALAALLGGMLIPGAGADTIPTSRTFVSGWNSAGYPGEIPFPARIVNVRDFGALGNGVSNDYTAFNAAVTSLNSKAGVVFVPAGNYFLNSSLSLKPGTVLRGQSSTNTTLLFGSNVTSHAIVVSKAQTGMVFQPIYAGSTLQSTVLTVSNGAAFSTGDYAEIQIKADPAWNVSSWSSNSVGQFVKIAAVSGNTVTIDQPLRLNMPSARTPVIRPLVPVTQVGVENLKVHRLFTGVDADARDNVYTIQFNYAAECWVRGVEGYNTFGGHVCLEYSTHVDIGGCYFHDAWEYDGGGSGYGTRFEYRSGENRVQNNIFKHLRHSMLFQIGANGNVCGYNYSFDCYKKDFIFGTDLVSDITSHGDYAYANLFEGNIVNFIDLDSSHGANGPYNTFFRNRVEQYGMSDESRCVDESYVGNDVDGSISVSSGSGEFLYGNLTSSGTTPAGFSNLNDRSYYLGTNVMQAPPVPSWWNITNTLPVIGPPVAYATAKKNPAKSRWDAGGLKTYAPPSVERLPPETVLALAGSTVTLSAKAHGSPSVAYAWFKNGAVIPGATSSNLVLAGVSAADQGNYTVSFTDNSGSLTSAPSALFLFNGALVWTNDHGFLEVAGNWDPPVGPPDGGETGLIASAGAPIEAVFRTNLAVLPAELIVGTGGVLSLAAAMTTDHHVTLDGGLLRPAAASAAVLKTVALKSDSAVGATDFALALKGRLSDHAAGAGKLVVSNAGAGAVQFYATNSPYSGGTELRSGEMQVYSNYATGSGPLEVMPEGLLKVMGVTVIQTNPVVMRGGWLRPGTNSAFKAPIQLRADSPAGAAGTNTLSLYGPIADHALGAGRLVVSNTGSGAVAFYSVGSTYSGGTEVRLGDMLVYSNAATGAGPVDVMPGGVFKPALATLIQANPVVLRGGRITPAVSSLFKAPIQLRNESVIGSTNALYVSVYGPITDHADGTGKLIVSNTSSGDVRFYSINSTYSGGTELRLGDMLVYSNDATGVGPVDVMPAGVFKPALATLIQANPVVLRGGRITPAVSSVFKAPIQIRNESVIGSTNTLYVSVYGPITDHADGTGKLIVSNTSSGDIRFFCLNSTYSGGTEVRLGNLLIYSNYSIGSGPMEVMPSGTVQVAASTVQQAPVVLKGGRIYAAANNTFNAPVELWCESYLDSIAASTVALLGPVRDFDATHAGRLIKKGIGYMALAGGTNTFSGGVEVREGTLACTVDRSLGVGDVNVLAGAILALSCSNSSHGASGITIQSNAIVQLSASYTTNIVVKPGGLVRTATGNINTYDRLRIEGDVLVQRQSGSGYSNYRSPFSDGAVPGRFVLATTNPFPVYLYATNLYTGGTLLTDGGTNKIGELILNTGGGLPDVGTVTLESNSVLNLNAVSDTIGSLEGFGEVKFGAAAATRLTVADGLETRFAGVISGTGGLVRAGTGALTLAGSNLWTGVAIVTGGLLRVNSELPAGGAVTVFSNAFIGGSGTIRRALALQPGGGFDWRGEPATLTVVTNGAFLFGTNAVFRYRFNAEAGSRLVVQGTLALPAQASVEVLPLAEGLGLPRRVVLMRADALSGASSLGGWRVTGAPYYAVVREGAEVVLRSDPGGMLLILR